MTDPAPTRKPATRAAIVEGFRTWLKEHHGDPTAIFIFRVTDGTRGWMHAETRETVYFDVEEEQEPTKATS